MIEDLFADDDSLPQQWQERLGAGAVILRGYAREQIIELLTHISELASQSPFRHLMTPGGRQMSVAMTCCGPLGWTSDSQGYRYTPVDPVTHTHWPAMPSLFLQLAKQAAAEAGYRHFNPDTCLINRYQPGAKLTLHQDKNERDMSQPIVSISLGLTATFLFGGATRESPCRRFPLTQGDTMVWGGDARLNYHGVLPVKEAVPPWPLSTALRYNLTFRRVMAP